MSNTYDIKIEQGSVFRRTLQWQNPDGTVVDLTGYSAAMQVRADYTTTVKLVDISTTPNSQGSIVFDIPAGLIWIEIKSAHTATLASGKAVYDFDIIEPGGEKIRLLEGKVVITPEVTR